LLVAFPAPNAAANATTAAIATMAICRPCISEPTFSPRSRRGQ
jgi:hypothetical protein